MRKRAFTRRPIIDGQDVETGRTFKAVNPATGEAFADVGRAGPAEIDAAVASASKAFLSWSKTPVPARQKHLARLLEEVRKAHEEVARLVATEQGKPVGEARAVDIVPAADTLRYLSRHAAAILAERPVDYAQILFAHKSGSVRLEPLGVVA
ncbi:MAG TPA: aldehyde dehydrogenase family protein, partial [Thermoanaerobaculia bacterium]|nr:aldehyde dehydrogenase family protein [Thermoanaerobaculia bacterium]